MAHNIRDKALLVRFGKNLRKIRKEKGMTQEYLADEAKISQIQVARIEKGHLNTTISTLHALCKALNTTADKFFE